MPQDLWQKLTDEQTFENAWLKVKSNLGAPGIDRVSVQEFGQNISSNLPLLRNLVNDGAYEPLPLKSFEKKHKSGKVRELHILTVRDKIVHEALLQVLKPVFEPAFLNCSYAYRTGRSQQKALERVERNLKRGRDHFFDGDIKSFFDEIDRKILLEKVGEKIPDKKILSLLQKCINAKDGPEGKGVAQGMAIAPLLSNVYLHGFDDKIMRAEWIYIRFSDNLLVLDKDAAQVTKAMGLIAEQLDILQLTLNPAKTSNGHISKGFVFLGYRFDDKGKRPSEQAIQRLGDKVGDALGKTAGLSEQQLKEKLDAIVRSWLNYFHLNVTDKRKLFEQLEQKFADSADSMPQRILKAALSFQLGDRLKARETLQSGPAVATEDAEINYQWGLLCELTGLQNEAYDSFLAAFRNHAGHAEAAYQIGLHYMRVQKFEQAIRYFQKATQIDPANASAQFALGTALQKMGLNGAAKTSFQKASQLDPNVQKRVPVPILSKGQIKQPPVIRLTRAAIASFLRLFTGREGVFARQWLSENGKIGYMPVYQPITETEINKHLRGEQTFGYYIMRTDNTVSQIMIDLDLTRQVREEIASPEGHYEEWKQLLWTDACRIQNILTTLELPCYIEDSGHKGLHVWLFLTEPQPAKQCILLAKKILEQAGDPPPGINREIFPKQPYIAKEAIGAMIKLPLGIHKLTNRRCLFLDEQGEPAPDQAGFVINIQTISANPFAIALDRLKKPAAPKKDISPQEQQKIDKILAGCNVLRHFKDKSEKEKWLNHLERLTVLSILGPMGDAGAQEIHNIIEHTANYSYRITQKFIDRKKGFPVSCPKIRQWHSHITPVVGCCCQFQEMKNSYPTPLLHADPKFIVKLRSVKGRKGERVSGRVEDGVRGREGERVSGRVEDGVRGREGERVSGGMAEKISSTISPAPSHPLPHSPSLPISDINAFMREFLETKKQHRSVSQKLAEMENRLNIYSNKVGKAVFETDYGTVRQVNSGGKLKWIIEI